MYPQQTLLKYSIALVACGVFLLLPNHAAANAENGIPPTIATYSPEEMVIAGADWTLSCTAEGNPEPTITWTRYGSRPIRNGKTTSTTGELSLTDIQIDDSGTYVCTATNGVGSPAQVETNFYVYSAPVVEPMEQTYSADIGSDSVLNCRIQGYPNMTANWRKKPASDAGDDLTITYLEHNEKYRMDVESIDTRFKDDVAIATEYRMEMRINNIQEEDFGTYECHAVNDRGSGKAEVKLQKRSEVTTVDPASTATKSTPCVVILTLLVMFIKL